jgi:hypothetical protein
MGVGIDQSWHEQMVWQLNLGIEAPAAKGGLWPNFHYPAAFNDKIARLVDMILGVKGDDLIRANKNGRQFQSSPQLLTDVL